MNKTSRARSTTPPSPGTHKLSRDTVFVIGDLLPLCDFAAVLLAAWLASLVYAGLAPGLAYGTWDGGGRAALAAAVLAPFILCDRAFVAFASGGRTAMLVRCYVARFLMFMAVVAAIGGAGRTLDALPASWLALWLAGTLLLTAGIRLLLVGNLRRLERRGVLTETVAIVGSGPVADRLIQHLRDSRGDSVEIIGVFDDRRPRGEPSLYPATGNLDALIELGKTRSMDWLLITLPGSAELRLQSLVHRLKAMAVPVGLCPQNIGQVLPWQPVRSLGEGMAVTLLADRPVDRWDRSRASAEAVLPRWVLSLLGLPLLALRLLSRPPTERSRRVERSLHCPIDDYDLDRFTTVAADFGQARFGYVVTPNADHLIRLHREPSFGALYASADYVLLDSRFIAKLLRLTKKLSLPVCTGSDLTARLFKQVIQPRDSLVLIGGSAEQANRLRELYGLQRLAHFNPPMGFVRDPAAVEECLRFVEQHSPFRYCLLAVGSPQQELLAQRLQQRGIARGMALCTGASINFLTGEEQRAPVWMQNAGLEWLFRLIQAPGRMAGRYLVRGPQIFWLLRRTQIALRSRREPLPAAARGLKLAA